MIQKIKLVGCRMGKCIVYTKVAEDTDKNIYVGKVDCASKLFAKKDYDGRWKSFDRILEIPSNQLRAYESFC